MTARGIPLGGPGPCGAFSGHCCLCRGHWSMWLQVGALCPALVAGLPPAMQCLAQTAGLSERVMGGGPPQSFCEPQLVRNPRVTGHHISPQSRLIWDTPVPRGQGWDGPSCSRGEAGLAAPWGPRMAMLWRGHRGLRMPG